MILFDIITNPISSICTECAYLPFWSWLALRPMEIVLPPFTCVTSQIVFLSLGNQLSNKSFFLRLIFLINTTVFISSSMPACQHIASSPAQGAGLPASVSLVVELV
jgi:hypothetical protein